MDEKEKGVGGMCEWEAGKKKKEIKGERTVEWKWTQRAKGE